MIVMILKFFSVGSSDISDFGESDNENVENLNANAPNLARTTNFEDVTGDPFDQNSGPNVPENFDVSAATPLNYFELLFKPEMFRKIVTHTNNYALFKRDETRAKKNEPDYVDNMWVNTSVDEKIAFFGMNLIMGINNLPQYKFSWHKRLISWQCWYKTNNASDEVREAMPIPPCIRQSQ